MWLEGYIDVASMRTTVGSSICTIDTDHDMRGFFSLGYANEFV